MLPVSILLIANSVIKSTRSIHCDTTVTKKSMQAIVTYAGGVEPAESSTIAGSAKGYSSRGSCEDTGPLWHRHEFQSSFGSLAGCKKDEANVPVSHVPCQRRHLLLDAPAAPALEWIKACKFPWQLVEFDRREEKPSFARSAPLWAWQQTQIALGKNIYSAVWWVLGLPLVAAWLFIETTFRHLAGAL